MMDDHIKALGILREARALIAKKKTWTQGAMARDDGGAEVSSTSPHAICYCSSGALSHVKYSHDWRLSFCEAHALAYNALSDAMDESITTFNDTHTYPTVMKRWDKAIDYLEACVKEAA